MNLYETKINHESAYVYADSVTSAIAKFNRLRRILLISTRIGFVHKAKSSTPTGEARAAQVATILGEPIYAPPKIDYTARLRNLLAEVS